MQLTYVFMSIGSWELSEWSPCTFEGIWRDDSTLYQYWSSSGQGPDQHSLPHQSKSWNNPPSTHSRRCSKINKNWIFGFPSLFRNIAHPESESTLDVSLFLLRLARVISVIGILKPRWLCCRLRDQLLGHTYFSQMCSYLLPSTVSARTALCKSNICKSTEIG